MRYYLNFKSVESSINILKENVNTIQKEELIKILENNLKKDFMNYQSKNLSNFETLKLVFISKSLKKYFIACGYKINRKFRF